MPEHMIGVVGGVSSRTGEPFIHLDWGEMHGQLTVGEARTHALRILEAAQNAITDAALAGFVRDEIKGDENTVVTMIDALRRYRSDHWGQPDFDLEEMPRDPRA